MGRAVFITHTVGLCLPLWSLMLGEGLCPAANEYAAPSTDDCGGGGGGGGSASCKRNNRKKKSLAPRIKYLVTSRQTVISSLSKRKASKQKQETRDVKAQVEKPVADQLGRPSVIWDIPSSLPVVWEPGFHSPVPSATDISQSSLFVCCWETRRL